MKNNSLKKLALNLNSETPNNFRERFKVILDENLSPEEFSFAMALDYTRSKLFNEPSILKERKSKKMAEGLYKLGYFFSLNSKDKLAYTVSCFSLPLLKKLDRKSFIYTNSLLFHMMCAFEIGSSAEVLRAYHDLVSFDFAVPEKLRFQYFNALGLVAMQLVPDSNPLDYFDEALKYAPNSTVKNAIIMNIADFLYLKRRYPEAMVQLENLEKDQSFAYMESYALTLELKILLQTGNLEDAKKITAELENLIRSKESWTDIVNSYVFLGHYHLRTGNIKKAKHYLKLLKGIPETDKTRYISGETKVLEAGVINTSNKPLQALEKTLTALHELSVYKVVSPHLGDLRSNIEESIKKIFRNLIEQLHEKDDYTALHTLRVSMISSDVGKNYGLSSIKLFNLTFGAMLHDYGKIDIPDEILRKPGKLTDEEFEIIKKHPVYGSNYLGNLSFPDEINDIVRHHHERIDGTGYPDGLKAEEVSDMVQIVAVADVYDALTTDRPYRDALTSKKALAIIEGQGNKLANKKIRGAFIQTIENNDYLCNLDDLDNLCRKTIALLG